MNDGYHNRRYAHARALAEKFYCNTCMNEKTVWQDGKDFTFDIPANLTMHIEKEKNPVSDENLFVPTNKTSQEKLWFPLQSLGVVP